MRKEPKQERSRDTVEAILEATARILGRRGWAGLNTNEVAAVAGVSIGSLYQYFPNKLALIEAVRQRHFERVLDALAGDGRIESIVQGMIDVHSSHPAIHEVLMEDAPRSRDSRVSHHRFEAEYLSRYEALFAARHPNRAVAAQVLSAAIAGVVHDAARRGTLGSQELKKELVRMASAYLEDKRAGR